jgi:hypothetical protein
MPPPPVNTGSVQHQWNFSAGYVKMAGAPFGLLLVALAALKLCNGSCMMQGDTVALGAHQKRSEVSSAGSLIFRRGYRISNAQL